MKCLWARPDRGAGIKNKHSIFIIILKNLTLRKRDQNAKGVIMSIRGDILAIPGINRGRSTSC